MSTRYARFDELLTLMKATHDRKGKDYEGQGRPYENLREGEDWNVQPWKMAMMRVGEKMRRVKSFATSGDLKNESVFDSLLDIAILSVIAYVLLEEEQEKAPATMRNANGTNITAGWPQYPIIFGQACQDNLDGPCESADAFSHLK